MELDASSGRGLQGGLNRAVTISPTFRADKDGVVQRIERAALTNNPALELTQLASQESYDDAEISEDEQAFRSELSQILGLEQQADRQSIIEALKALINQQDDQSSDGVEAMASMIQDVAEERLKVKMARVRDKVAGAISSGVMPPAMRSWMIRLCSQDEDAFDEMLVKVGTPFSYLAEEQITDGMIQMATNGEASVLNQSLDEEVAAQLGIDPASMT